MSNVYYNFTPIRISELEEDGFQFEKNDKNKEYSLISIDGKSVPFVLEEFDGAEYLSDIVERGDYLYIIKELFKKHNLELLYDGDIWIELIMDEEGSKKYYKKGVEQTRFFFTSTNEDMERCYNKLYGFLEAKVEEDKDIFATRPENSCLEYSTDYFMVESEDQDIINISHLLVTSPSSMYLEIAKKNGYIYDYRGDRLFYSEEELHEYDSKTEAKGDKNCPLSQQDC